MQIIMTAAWGITTRFSEMITVKGQVQHGSRQAVSNSLQFFSSTVFSKFFLFKCLMLEQGRQKPISKHHPWLMAFPILLSVPLALPLPSITETPQTDIGRTTSLYATSTLPSSPNLVSSTPGSIRVSNSTYHPIRIALLPQVQPSSGLAHIGQQVAISQQTESESLDHPPTATRELPQYGAPIHWDFVPREGHDSGLVLAVSDGHVKVQQGDVLTAFAQDGSRRYWGPYVVGVTDSPVWNSETQEWSLVLDTPFPF